MNLESDTLFMNSWLIHRWQSGLLEIVFGWLFEDEEQLRVAKSRLTGLALEWEDWDFLWVE